MGVFIQNNNSNAISNENVELYYTGKSLPIGTNEHDFGLPDLLEKIADGVVSGIETKFDFNSALIQDGHWFYYGIDSSWKYYQEHLGDTGIFDFANWKLMRR